MDYQEVIDFLYSQLPMYQKIGKAAFNKDLGKTLALMKGLGNPQERFESIHIAGTNGKGSTAHLMASILQASGLKVGLYTSPHLKSFRERVRVNGSKIDKTSIVTFVNKNKALIEQIEPSFFEITVAMAFDYFDEQQVDVAIIETGLGGRLDSTNIITPVLSIITSVSMDHQDILGDDLKSIALEKAGIIKDKVPVVLGDLPFEARSVIESVALEHEAPCTVSSALIQVSGEGGSHSIHQKGELILELTSPQLIGDALVLNLPTVMASVLVLKNERFTISDEAIKLGIENVCSNTGLMGRWQVLSNQPLIVCDVGHNEEAILGLMKRIMDIGSHKTHIVWGMAIDKVKDSIFQMLPKDAQYYFCAAKMPRAVSPESLLQIGNGVGLSGSSYSSVDDAFLAAKNEARHDDMIFIGGSTFVVSELDVEWEEKK